MQDCTKFDFVIRKCHHIVQSRVYNSHVEFSKRDANAIINLLAKSIIYSASS